MIFYEDDYRPHPDYPSILVNPYARFFNSRLERTIPTSSVNGHLKVNLIGKEGGYTSRSVARLVAEIFLDPPKENFDTVIHLDGDLSNCVAFNLMWRPRWFAIRYHQQFAYDSFHGGYATPTLIEDVDSGKRYSSIKEVCTTDGLYYFDVQKSLLEETITPITGQRFRYV